MARDTNSAPGWVTVAKFRAPLWSIGFNPSFFLRRSIYRWVTSALRASAGKCLDFGCGAAPYKSAFPGYYVGVDVPVSGHDHRSSRIDVFIDGSRLPFASGAFDVVLASEVLEHVKDPVFALEEIARVLAPGGALIVTVPFLFPEHEMPYDFRRLTLGGLQALLSARGFSVTRAERFGRPPEVLGQLWLRYWFELLRDSRLKAAATPLLCAAINVPALLLSYLLPGSSTFYLGSGLVCVKQAQ